MIWDVKLGKVVVRLSLLSLHSFNNLFNVFLYEMPNENLYEIKDELFVMLKIRNSLSCKLNPIVGTLVLWC